MKYHLAILPPLALCALIAACNSSGNGAASGSRGSVIRVAATGAIAFTSTPARAPSCLSTLTRPTRPIFPAA